MPPEQVRAQPSNPKNIMIFCDGTGNMFVDKPEAEGSNSNVVKLYTTLRIYNGQVGYYHPGVGTAADPTARNWFERQWTRIEGLAFGGGFKDNVLDAYHYLMDQYDDGDQVYIFGFSRGAYTARALAGLLDGYGLLCRGNEGHLPYAWNAYVNQHKKRERHKVEPNKSFKETFSRPDFRIHFLGVWDTVSSVGWISSPVRLFNVAANPLIDIGRHAVSIDERRCYFRDNLWQGAAPEQDKPEQDMLEVWFPGVHCDVGGSYAQVESVLSNGPLKWLISEAENAGAKIKPHMKQLVLGEPVVPMPEDPVEMARVIELQKIYPEPKIAEVHKSLYGLWWLLEVLPHVYYDKDEGKENWRVPFGMRRRIPSGRKPLPDGRPAPPTYIHGSAFEYMQPGSSFRYAPKNLIGGLASLTLASVPGQTDRIYLYNPPHDPKPLQNQAWFRWTLISLVIVVEVLLALVILCLLCHVILCVGHKLMWAVHVVAPWVGHKIAIAKRYRVLAWLWQKLVRSCHFCLIS